MKVLYSILLFTSLVNISIGQDLYTKENCKERSGFEYGGLAGIYLPYNSNADFYSGKPGNENDVPYLFNNSYWYEEMRHLLDFNDTAFVLEYPERMGYSPSFSFGLFVKYDLDCHSGIYLQFYYVKLKANDIVTVEVDPPQDYLAEPDIRLCPIKGVEERNIVDLGYTYSFGMSKNARLTLGGGVSMNNSLVKENVIYIGEKKYNLVHVYGNRPYIPNSGQQTYEIRQGGIGFGAFGNIGVRMEFSPSIAIEPGCSLHYMMVNLKEKSDYTPEINCYVKLIFRDLLDMSN